MCFQMTCLRGWIITLVAFIWLLSTVCSHMSSQSACLWGCKITLVAFVWFFSTVRFQMSSQIACRRRGKVALVAIVWIVSFIICVSQGNIYIDSTFSEVIIHQIVIHHKQGLLSLVHCQFQTETRWLQIKRENKWKWKWLLNTIWLQDHDCKIINLRHRQWKKQRKYSNKEGNIIALWVKLCNFLKVNNVWMYVMMMKYEKSSGTTSHHVPDSPLSTYFHHHHHHQHQDHHHHQK